MKKLFFIGLLIVTQSNFSISAMQDNNNGQQAAQDLRNDDVQLYMQRGLTRRQALNVAFNRRNHLREDYHRDNFAFCCPILVGMGAVYLALYALEYCSKLMYS